MSIEPVNDDRIPEARVMAIDLRAITSSILGVEAQGRMNAVITIEVPGQPIARPEDHVFGVIEPPVYRLLPNLDFMAVFNFVMPVAKDNLLCHDLRCQFTLSQEHPTEKWTMRVSDQNKQYFPIDICKPGVEPVSPATEAES